MKITIKKGIKTAGSLLLIFSMVISMFVACSEDSNSAANTPIAGHDNEDGGLVFTEESEYKLDGIDGPYLIGDELISITDDNQIVREVLHSDSIKVIVNNSTLESFVVPLRNEFVSSPAEYELPDKVIAISDIEGNFDAFSGFLQKNNVIDENLTWTFGNGHLVLVGDFVDRGSNVIQTLWLIYKLEQEAEKANGKVHFLLGNHEIMNIQGDFRYALDKYKRIAEEIGEKARSEQNYPVLFSEESHLGKWLRSKNVVEKLGSYIFVHAGISPEILPLEISLNEINQIVRDNIDISFLKKSGNEKISFLMGVKSPYWYRGLVKDYTYYPKITKRELSDVLQYYDAKKIVIGHSVMYDISTSFSGRIIRIDVKHGERKFSGKTKGLIIEDGKEFKVNDFGNRIEL